MKKTYRISVYNRTTAQRELIYQTFTSKRKAQDFADKMNALDPTNTVRAYVVVKEQ